MKCFNSQNLFDTSTVVLQCFKGVLYITEQSTIESLSNDCLQTSNISVTLSLIVTGCLNGFSIQ